MRASREKVEGLPFDGFIFLHEKGELEYGMVGVTRGQGRCLGTNGTVLGGGEGSGEGGGNDVWASSLQNLREKMNGRGGLLNTGE